MAADSADSLFLVEFYREFYAAVLNYRAQLEADGAAPEDEDSVQIREADILAEEEQPDADGGGRGQRALDSIQTPLLELMEAQTQAVQRRGDPREQKRFTEIQYVMAAMADEVFLAVEWPGKELWSTHLLEERLFGTHDAGTRFFDNLDALLLHRDATRADVLMVYMLALSLGFRGKLREVSAEAQVAHYRTQAYATLFQRNPALPETTPLFPQAYAHTRGGQQPSWLPQLRPWVLSLFAVAFLYLMISHLIWDRRATAVAARLDELAARSAPDRDRSGGRSDRGSRSARGARKDANPDGKSHDSTTDQNRNRQPE